MGDRGHGWTTVGHRLPAQRLPRAWEAEQELDEREAMAAWDRDEHWPGINKPFFEDPKRFDARLIKIEDLGSGAFGRVDKVVYGSVALARKRITRKRGLTIDDLRQEALTMRKLDHCHVVKLVATYAPRSHELCLLIWPAAVCSLSVLLDDLESLRLGDGDGEDISERLEALGLSSASKLPSASRRPAPADRCPLDFLCTVLGCAARAMAHCHAEGVRHLDIKPSNILLKPDRVYLADFGVSRDVSGQDHTTTDGLPGTEKWRAPELYGAHGSSMQLSDMYSLGLVYLNIATVLYDARLADFDEALRYPPWLSLDEQLRTREDKVKKHLDKLTACAYLSPHFTFAADGQETVRPRPVVSLVSHMVAANPRSRLPAEKIDEKLSVLGGIHQIYHAPCCKRPVSWVQDRWDKKLSAMASLKDKNEQLRRRVVELEGKDETYEARLDNARKAHEQDVKRLQDLLREAEDKCQRLEQERAPRRRNQGHDARGREAARPGAPGMKLHAAAVGLGDPSKPRPTPAKSAAHAAAQPSRSAHRGQKDTPPQGRKASGGSRPGPGARSQGQPSPGATNWSEYQMRSRGSGSKLPLPVTPNRSGTPMMAHDQSMTDSSMSSSVFSRHSSGTVPTPANDSPQLRRTFSSAGQQLEQWTKLPPRAASPPPESGASASSSGRATTPLGGRSPVLSTMASASSPRALRSLVSDSGDGESTTRPTVPTLQPMKSWAEVAKLDRRSRRG